MSFSVQAVYENPGSDCVKQSQKFLPHGSAFIMNLNTVTRMLTKNMVYFRGRNLSFTLGQSTQFCDKADYMAIPPFRSADSVPLVLQLQVTIQYHAIFLLSYFIHYIQQADN